MGSHWMTSTGLRSAGRSWPSTGLSAARLDRWLLSQQLQPWVSTAWDSLTQTAGYPGDHIGVGVTLTAPGGTCFGRAAWRLPLQILDAEPELPELPEPATRPAAQARQPYGGQSAGQPGPLGHAAAPQPQSAALQQLEAAVARSRHGRSDRRGLGSRPAASVAAPHVAAFVAGATSSQLQDMDCTPPAPALLLPARGHAIDMDIDTAQLQNGTVASPQPMQIERPQMPSAVRDELMEWMESHTALSMQHSRAAIAQLLSRMPHLLMAQPIPEPVYAALRDIDDAETQRQLRAESRPVRQRCHSPAVPPGFELQAAHSAVARATTGLRRSSRASRPLAAYWMAQPSGRMASSQRPGSQ